MLITHHVIGMRIYYRYAGFFGCSELGVEKVLRLLLIKYWCLEK